MERGSPSLTVLLVDDDRLVRGVIAGWLNRCGYAVIESSDGEEAWKELQRIVPDVVVSDLQMPRCSGWELVRRIRATPALAGLPIVVVTGSTLDARADRLGCDRLLQKPFSPEQLLEAVRTVVDRWQATPVSAERAATPTRAAGG